MLGDIFPNFSKETSIGTLNFYDWAEDKWVVFVSHPADYTPVCTTELGGLAKMHGLFVARNAKLIALSCNDSSTHLGWIKDIEINAGLPAPFPFPIIADDDRDLAHRLGMVDDKEVDSKGLPMSCRAVFIISPDHKVRLSILYPASTGRNLPEIVRVLDSLQMTDKYRCATPADWKAGSECMVQPSVKPEEVAVLFPKGVRTVDLPSCKPYMRFTPDPST